MRINYFMEKLANLRIENRLLKFCIVVIGISSIVSSYFSYKALNYQKVVLVPPGFEKKITVWGNGADDEYIAEFTKYISFLLLTNSPANIRAQLGEILKYVDPGAYPGLKEKLYDLADTIELSRVSSAFYPGELEIRRGDGRIRVTVRGVLVRRSEGGQIVDQGTRSFTIEYRMEEGRLLITSLPVEDIERVERR